MSMMVRAVAALLGTMLAAASGGCFAVPGSEEHDDLAGQWDRLREAGTVSVAFKGSLSVEHPFNKTAGQWAGTSVLKFDEQPSSDTTYTQVDATTIENRTYSSPMRELRIGDERWFRADNLRTDDKRPWIRREAGTKLFVGDDYGDPNLGVTDLALWLRFLKELPEASAVAAKNSGLKDVPGAPREYHVMCLMNTDTCPKATFGTGLDSMFDKVSVFNLDCWVGEDGRLKRLEATLLFLNDSSQGVPHNLKATFDVTAFGAPLAVAPPPAAEVSEGRSVQVIR